MFWRVASFNQTSPVEAVLDRADFTLEDLLEEDDLIQVPQCGCSASPSSSIPCQVDYAVVIAAAAAVRIAPGVHVTAQCMVLGTGHLGDRGCTAIENIS